MNRDGWVTLATAGPLVVLVLVLLSQPFWPQDPSQFWPKNLVDYAQIVSALATAGAVMVSLYVVLHQPAPKLTGHAGLRLVVGGSGPRMELLSIGVTNVGAPDAEIVLVGWRAGSGANLVLAVQGEDFGPGAVTSSPLPCRLRHGERAAFHFRTGGIDGWLSVIAFQGFFPETLNSRPAMESLLVTIHTTVGPETRIKPERALLDRIWEQQAKFLALPKMSSIDSRS